MNFKKVERKDNLPEYGVVTDQYFVEYGAPRHETIGFVTKFGDKSWTFRSNEGFSTPLSPVQEFSTRKEAAEAGVSNIVKASSPEMAPKQVRINPRNWEKLIKPVGKNNRKRTKYRKTQYVDTVVRDADAKPVLDARGNMIKTGKKKLVAHV